MRGCQEPGALSANEKWVGTNFKNYLWTNERRGWLAPVALSANGSSNRAEGWGRPIRFPSAPRFRPTFWCPTCASAPENSIPAMFYKRLHLLLFRTEKPLLLEQQFQFEVGHIINCDSFYHFRGKWRMEIEISTIPTGVVLTDQSRSRFFWSEPSFEPWKIHKIKF